MSVFIRVCLLAMVMCIATDTWAQEKRISVSSNVDSATVFIDDVWAGRVADSPFVASTGASKIAIRLPWLSAWSVEPLLFDLEAGDSAIDALFPYHYRFESTPSGAAVEKEGNRLGQTPFVLVSESPISEDVRVSMPGYLDVVPELGDAIWNLVRVELTADASSMAIGSDHIVPSARKDWVSIAATASAFAAGALAIHFRTKADNRFDDYQISGKESLRSDIQQFDVQSGVALGFMHAGLGIVVFRLAF